MNPIRSYHFSWNGKNKFVDAESYSEARRIFQEKFGFYPEEKQVNVTVH